MKVLFLIGSDNDRSTVEASKSFYDYFGIPVDFIVSSAHRAPEQTARLAASARSDGYGAIVCAAGMAAHLAGLCAACSDLPVIGVPLAGGVQDGLDALLSTAQMPKGVPVATLSVGKAGAINSAVLCARIFSLNNEEVRGRLESFRASGCDLPDS